MAIRAPSLLIMTVCVLSGCTTQQWIRESLCDERSGGSPTSRAARCITVAAYEIAQRKGENSQNQATADEDKENEKHEGKEADPRYKEWIP
jgi:hypothetical protein